MSALPLEPDDPREVGRYRLTGRLGEGGQGVVYLGTAPDGRPVAVKVLKTTAPAALARFAREMEAAKRVAPFCTAAVLESSTAGRNPYVVSEYVDGPSLQQRVAERGPLRGGDLDRLMVNTASGLTAIHGAGIVHRDLKPANVLLGPDGPRVVDFGIARAVDAETQTQMVGTPAYFAPEWLHGEPPTPASDVFAWAGTMVFAATGRSPFGGGSNIPALMHRIATAPPDLAEVPDRLRGLLAECLDKDPARRPAARDLLVRLADPSSAVPTTPPPAPPPPLTSPPSTSPVPDLHTVGDPAQTSLGRALAVTAVLAGIAAAMVLGLVFFLSEGDGDGSPAGAATSPSPVPSASPEVDQGVPAAFAGTWQGTARRKNLLGDERRSTVTIRLTRGSSEGAADYPGFDCKTRLSPVDASGTTLEFKEEFKERPVDQLHLTVPGFCKGFIVRLTLRDDGKMRYEHPSGLSGQSFTIVLTRK